MAGTMDHPPVDKRRTTILLQQVTQRKPGALNELVEQVLPQLRILAQSCLRGERPDPNSLRTTALINELYLRLVEQLPNDFQSRSHFYGIASRLMRQILVDDARRRHRQKRGGDTPHVEFEQGAIASPDHFEELLLIDDALNRLNELDERQAQIVEMRFFAQSSEQEMAEVLGVSTATVKRDLRLARAWLYRALNLSVKKPPQPAP
jgi:RNA polymerase sigma factor (TIGR02999 family)